MRDDKLLSGFLNHDYVLTFSIGDESRRKRMVELCQGPWMGDMVAEGTWEVSNDLGPDDMEKALVALLGEGDRCAYYYLTPPMESGVPGQPPTKRIFRVVLG
jgi:hypothetical protein